MSDEQKYTIQGLDEYIRQGEPQQRERSEAWKVAIGALVRANYSDLTAGISETTIFLERFFRSMLLGEEHDLRNRIMHVDWGKVADDTSVQSANKLSQSAELSDELPSKCKNCTLEEVAVLRIMHENSTATQKEIATAIGKSERTVKTITVALQEKLIVKRVNGKRNGYWEFIE